MLVRDLFFQGAEDAAVAFFAEGFAVFEEYWFMNRQREFECHRNATGTGE